MPMLPPPTPASRLVTILKGCFFSALLFMLYSAGVMLDQLGWWPSGLYRQLLQTFAAQEEEGQIEDEDKQEFGNVSDDGEDGADTKEEGR